MTQQQTERDEALIAEARKNLDARYAWQAAGAEGPYSLAKEVLRLERLRGDEPAKPVDPVESLLDEIVSCATLDETGKHYHFEAEAMVSTIRHALNEAEARGRNEAFRLNNQPSSGVAPPAKPDRYMQVAEEFIAAWYEGPVNISKNREQFQAAAAVLRKHFEPPSEVVEAAKDWRDNQSGAGIMARFILKGYQ